MIEIKGLNKIYGQFVALNNLDLTIKKGTVFGFVGPNGAGKTTTMSIVATLLSPTSGTAIVGGFDVTRQPAQVRKLIGYMPDFFGVYDHFKTTEYLDFYGASYGIPRSERAQLIPQLLELVNLSDKKDFYVDTLSRGMKQRLCLARCLVHDPELLILDEPASGLDPRARIEMREILKELKRMGKTIMISSHILPELAEMVDEIGIIEHGTLIANGNVKEIQAQMQVSRVLHIRVSDRAEQLVQLLKDEANVSAVDLDAEKVLVQFSGGDLEQEMLLRKLIGLEFPIISFNDMAANLEDVFLEMTRGAEHEAITNSN